MIKHSINVAGTPVQLSSSITTLGDTLSFHDHINIICKSCYFHRRIRSSLPGDVCSNLAAAIIQSRLDSSTQLLRKNVQLWQPDVTFGHFRQRLRYISWNSWATVRCEPFCTANKILLLSVRHQTFLFLKKTMTMENSRNMEDHEGNQGAFSLPGPCNLLMFLFILLHFNSEAFSSKVLNWYTRDVQAQCWG